MTMSNFIDIMKRCKRYKNCYTLILEYLLPTIRGVHVSRHNGGTKLEAPLNPSTINYLRFKVWGGRGGSKELLIDPHGQDLGQLTVVEVPAFGSAVASTWYP